MNIGARFRCYQNLYILFTKQKLKNIYFVKSLVAQLTFIDVSISHLKCMYGPHRLLIQLAILC